jgi:hypothetical protein
VLQIVNTLAPVFLLMALGAALRRGGFLTPELTRGVNRLAYWVALPALLFQSTATAEFSGGAGRTVVVMLVALVGVTLLALAGALALRLPSVTAGTFVHVAVRGNVSFVGVPVLFYILEGQLGAAAGPAKSLAVLVLAPFILVQNVIGITALLAGHHEPGRQLVKRVAREIVTHPLLIAVAAGLVVSGAGWRLPVALDRSFQAVGAIALPVALLAIGASLVTVSIRGHRTRALLASGLKLVVLPLAGYGLGRWLGLDREAMLYTLVYLACPTGASSFTVVAEMGGEEALASTTIVLSTLLSAVPLALIVAWY